jgi:hypothetical protein
MYRLYNSNIFCSSRPVVEPDPERISANKKSQALNELMWALTIVETVTINVDANKDDGEIDEEEATATMQAPQMLQSISSTLARPSALVYIIDIKLIKPPI